MKFGARNAQQRIAAVAKRTSTLGFLCLIASLAWTSPASANSAAEARQLAKQIFGTLPSEVANSENSITPAKIELGRKLYDAAPQPKQFEAIPRAGHNDTVYEGGAPYFQKIASFLDRVAPPHE